MKPDHPEEPRRGVSKDQQLETFKAGVAHLGSVEKAARWMQINPASLRYVLNGRRALHDGHCRALASALVAHTAVSRELERRISPAFRANLTPEQATQKPHGNRFDQREQPNVDITIPLTRDNLPPGALWEADGACWRAVLCDPETTGCEWRWQPLNSKAWAKPNPEGEMTDFLLPAFNAPEVADHG